MATSLGRGGNLCRGYFAIPDVVNMLDNERTRWINATLFFAIGWQVTLMVVSPAEVDVPFEKFKMSNFPFILRKLLTISYYLVVFAPVVMGLPRWDFFGLMITMLYVWIFAIFNFLRDYNCAVYWNPYFPDDSDIMFNVGLRFKSA